MQTPEQLALSDAIAARQPTSGRACAGTGKSTTAVHGIRRTPANGQGVLALAFNKSAQMDLENKLKGTNAEAKTLNGLGHKLVMQFLGNGTRLRLDTNKMRGVCDALFTDMEWDDRVKVQKLAREARIMGIVPERITWLKGLTPDTQENWEALTDDIIDEGNIPDAQRLLTQSCLEARRTGLIDFDDQIYLSALNANKIYGYDQLVVDEAQDLNPLQHKMLTKFQGASLAIIGDPRQSIYGFRGAVTNSMGALEDLFDLNPLPLTVSWRCNPGIIEFAQQWVPEISSGLTGDSRVEALDEWNARELSADACVLARCNAPLLRLAFALIKVGRRPNFLGRDIGKSLASTLNQITRKENLQGPILIVAIEKWFAKQIELAELRKQDYKIETLEDRRESLFAVLEQSNARDSNQLAKHLKDFAQTPGIGITLSSIHRAKGLEWPTVYWLDIDTNYKFTQKAQGEDKRQEQNLCYVAATRAKSNLLFIDTQRTTNND